MNPLALAIENLLAAVRRGDATEIAACLHALAVAMDGKALAA